MVSSVNHFQQQSATCPMPSKLLATASFQLTPAQVAWLDARRQHGNLSRSAALRQALDSLIAQDAQTLNARRKARQSQP